jgi:formylmethanofuran dehydrogenase subunit D
VQADQSSVSADDVRGSVVVTTSHGDVVVKNFYEDARVATSYRDVMLAPAGELAGNVEVENNHGEIKLLLSPASRFQLDAASENGSIKPIGFVELAQKARESLVASVGSDGPAIKLRTSYKNIIVQANGSRQTQASAVVN